ncbi:hypothetical protein EMIT0P253_130047 [Pseudomonas sp. IT-P253]
MSFRYDTRGPALFSGPLNHRCRVDRFREQAPTLDLGRTQYLCVCEPAREGHTADLSRG